MGCPGIFDISDRFEKLYLSEVFQLLRIEAETERSILDSKNWLAGDKKTFSRLVIEGGDEIGVGGGEIPDVEVRRFVQQVDGGGVQVQELDGAVGARVTIHASSSAHTHFLLL